MPGSSQPGISDLVLVILSINRRKAVSFPDQKKCKYDKLWLQGGLLIYLFFKLLRQQCGIVGEEEAIFGFQK